MSSTFTIIIPGKPLARQAHEMIKLGNGKRINKMPKESENFQALVAMAARKVMGSHPPISGMVKVDYLFVFPAPKTTLSKLQRSQIAGGHNIHYEKIRADFDNLCKSVNDGLKTIAIEDDSLIVDGSFQKRIGAIPCTVVTIIKL